MPTIFANCRLKLDTESNPTASDMLNIDKSDESSRSHARLTRRFWMNSSGEQPMMLPKSRLKCVPLR